jgi:hypothetical protein
LLKILLPDPSYLVHFNRMLIRMRGLLFIGLLVSFRVNAQTAKTDVPSSIRVRFMEEFISAKNISWQQVKNEEFTVSFYHQGQNKKAFFSTRDTTMTLEITLLSLTQIPDEVSKSIASKYRHYYSESITKILDSRGEVFRVILHKDDARWQVIFQNDGKRLSRIRIF